jgi:hypothetical protein
MANFIKKTASKITEAFGDVLEDRPMIVEEDRIIDPPVMKFPIDLEDKGRPMIRFTCIPSSGDEGNRSVFFPCPQGVSYSDGGSYTTIDIGIIGTIAKIAATEGNTLDKVKKGGEIALKEAQAAGGIGASILVAKALGRDNIATAIEFANKQVRNPRTNTAFSGNTLRNFQFDFKMIGKSKQEVKTIDAIQRVFREKVYASKLGGVSSFMLKYPPKWIIEFLEPKGGEELTYMPKIYSCYLTAANTVINASSNTFRDEDMSPYEIDVSLQFQETKILTRDEIISLEAGVRENEFDEAFDSLTNTVKQLEQGSLKTLKGLTKQATEVEEQKVRRVQDRADPTGQFFNSDNNA